MTKKNVNIATDPEWSSHQPLIQAVMDFYKPKFVLELGMSKYSTPFFLKPDVEYLGIENDKDWIEHLKTELGNINCKFHFLGEEVKISTHYPELSESKKKGDY